MPYKMGDSMWALPAAKEIAKIYGPVDFVLGSYCKPLVRLYEYQKFINTVIIDERVDELVCGVVQGIAWSGGLQYTGYERTYDIAFYSFPPVHIPQYFAGLAEVNLPEKLEIDAPKVDKPFEHYVVVNYTLAVNAGKGLHFNFRQILSEVIQALDIPVIQVGGEDDCVTIENNMCGLDMYDTAAILAQADYLISAPSAHAVLGSLLGVPQVMVIPEGFSNIYDRFKSLGDVRIVDEGYYSTEADIVAAILKT